MAGRPKEFDPDTALAEATDVFWRLGYEATGVQDLLDAMAINRASMYDTFGCKHELFLEAMRHYGAQFDEHLAATLDADGSPIENLRALFRGMEDKLYGDHEGCKGCLITNTAIELAHRDEAVASELKAQFGRLEHAFGRLLKRAATVGEIPADAPVKRHSAFLVAVMHGIVVTAKAGSSRAAARHVVDLALATVVRGG